MTQRYVQVLPWKLCDHDAHFLKDSKIRLFPNRNALRSFLVRRSAQFGAESRYFAKVFGAGPTGQKEKQYHHSTQSHPNTQERIDRVLRYAGLYKGWKSTVKVDFYRWVYAQDIKAVSWLWLRLRLLADREYRPNQV